MKPNLVLHPFFLSHIAKSNPAPIPRPRLNFPLDTQPQMIGDSSAWSHPKGWCHSEPLYINLSMKVPLRTPVFVSGWGGPTSLVYMNLRTSFWWVHAFDTRMNQTAIICHTSINHLFTSCHYHKTLQMAQEGKTQHACISWRLQERLSQYHL